MNNCYVKTLKTSVNNDSLPVLGTTQVTYISNSTNFLYDGGTVTHNRRFKARITEGNSYFIIGNDTETHLTSVDTTDEVSLIKAANEDAHFEIDCLASSVLFGIPDNNGNINEFWGSETVEVIKLQRGNNAQGQFITARGSIEAFGDKYINLVSLECKYEDTVTGDIAIGFGKCIKIGEILAGYSSGLSGTLESLAAAQKTNGRTSGKFRVQGNANITAGGNTFANSVKWVQFGSSMVNPTAAETAQGWCIR